MNTQKQLFELAQKRGVIPDIPLSRLNYLFLDKLQEEIDELIMSLYQNNCFDTQEVADVFIVICNLATANNINIEQEALKKTQIDVTRKPK